MVRRQTAQHQRVKVPSGQATERPVAGPSPREETQRPSGASRASSRREQEYGPQHQVNPTASSDLKWRSRADHVTVKAKSDAYKSETASATGSSGVGGVARIQGGVRDAGDPSEQPQSGQGRAYKPKAKARGVRRESEGAKVLRMVAHDNAAGGTGPCFSQASREGKREGMERASEPNDPEGNHSLEEARELQGKLYATAKQYAGRHSNVSCQVHGSDVPWKAGGLNR